MKKKAMIAFALTLTYIAVYFIGYFSYDKILKHKNDTLENKVIYEVEVVVEKINLRKKIDLESKPIKQVYKGEIFRVVEYYEGSNYNWYKIIYDEGKAGWIASGKVINWVEIKK